METKPTIIFVDDEVSVLNGLRRSLFEQDDRWNMLFISNAREALDLIKKEGVDIVISDMRMPDMDGAALLDEVSRHHPSAARFILSGFSEHEAVFRTLGPAHQYFVKPCNSDVLSRAIERTLFLRNKIKTEKLLEIVSGAKTIPVMPQALSMLLTELQSGNTSTTEISNIILSDIGLTIQILKLVNSAYFFLPAKVADVFQAVKLLGFDLIRSISILAGIFQSFQTSDIDMASIQRLENRSLIIGEVAKRIAQYEGLDRTTIEQCYCAGMLAHVGTLILFANRANEMKSLHHKINSSGSDIIEVERHLFGASHQELSGCLLDLWGFNDIIVEAVLCHHHPSDAGASADVIGPMAIVHVAQQAVKTEMMHEQDSTVLRGKFDTAYLDRIGAAGRIEAWVQEAKRYIMEFPTCP